MKKIKVGLVLALITCSLTISAQVSFEPDSTFYYKTTAQGKLKMDVFKPINHKVTDKRPVVVFFFGGGWSNGSTKQFYQQARYFSDRGILAISAEYRIKSKHKTSPFECVIDGESAVRWVREHASKLGIDPDRVIASGGSAGVHVAACTGIIELYNEEGEDFSISSKPNAMILYNPVVNTIENAYVLKKISKNRKREISPFHHVKLGIPPTLIYHGTADKSVPFKDAERFTNLMNEVGNICELIAFKDKEHGFFHGSFFRKTNTDVDFNITMEKSMEFLVNINRFSNNSVFIDRLRSFF